MKLDWRYSIGIGTLFFVAGQVLLRKSFDSSSDYMISLLYFTSAIAIMTFIGCVYLKENIFDITRLTSQHYNAISAGIVFFFGFIFWIYSISTKNDLGIYAHLWQDLKPWFYLVLDIWCLMIKLHSLNSLVLYP